MGLLTKDKPEQTTAEGKPVTRAELYRALCTTLDLLKGWEDKGLFVDHAGVLKDPREIRDRAKRELHRR